jgi:DNA mismatch repair protein MutL
MGNVIIKLPEELANCIAAGEVVERPASVVKELIENSIDAGAGTVTVETKGSGKKHIRVTDDGTGIVREDAILAFERHATSKIKTVQDLNAISTLGFRGEALPSIASVSNVKLLTCFNGDAVGTEVELGNGKIKSVRDAPPLKGTSIEVKDLFLNIPARLKFLKADTTELSHIIEVVNQHALSHPSIKFCMKNGEKRLIDTFSTDSRLDRIASIFGYGIADKLMPINEKRGYIKIEGYICKPGMDKSNRGMQYIFVNNRYIRDRTINHAVYEGFRTMLPKDRHPIYFLFLDIDPAMVDVNVHPTKIEVRFVRQNEIHDFVRDIIRDSMKSRKEAAGETSSILNTGLSVQGSGFEVYSKTEYTPAIDLKIEQYKNRVKETVENFGMRDVECGIDSKFQIPHSGFQLLPETKSLLSHDPSAGWVPRPVGQVFDSFIVLEGADNIIFIDQHTAHERILYERFLNKFKNSKIEVQNLLLPINIELTAKESVVLQSHLDIFKRLGFDIESFGDNSFIIRSAPSLVSGGDCKELVRDILDRLLMHQQDISFDEIVNDIILIMACRYAVKANQKLSLEEMGFLVKELGNTSRPFTCPHGRPIALSIERGQILKGFLRR